jgi:hypothetical protein
MWPSGTSPWRSQASRLPQLQPDVCTKAAASFQSTGATRGRVGFDQSRGRDATIRWYEVHARADNRGAAGGFSGGWQQRVPGGRLHCQRVGSVAYRGSSRRSWRTATAAAPPCAPERAVGSDSVIEIPVAIHSTRPSSSELLLPSVSSSSLRPPFLESLSARGADCWWPDARACAKRAPSVTRP